VNKLLLALAIPLAIVVLLCPTRTGGQVIPPPAKRAARVQITEGPELESVQDTQAIIRWTSNNPGGTDEHFAFARYGTDPNHLTQTAKSHIRLNRNHSYTIFRVRLLDLKPGTTYYYKVDSMQADGTLDGVNSTVYRLDTPRNP
jgi:phosphodiesterase/alkaline phosphatase D-like protein